MALSETELSRIRTRTNGTESSMSDAYLNDIESEMAEEYSTHTRRVVVQAVEVQVWNDLLTRAVTQTDYDEGDASEKRSQVFKHLQQMRDTAQAKLDDLLEETTLPARWGGLRKKPRYKDRPRYYGPE